MTGTSFRFNGTLDAFLIKAQKFHSFLNEAFSMQDVKVDNEIVLYHLSDKSEEKL